MYIIYTCMVTWHAIFFINKAFIYYVLRPLNRVNIIILNVTLDPDMTRMHATYKVGMHTH